MLRFRSSTTQPASGSCSDLFAVGQLIDDALQPGNFFVAPELALSWSAARSETIPWEIFRGRLLDPAHTRAMRSFLSWHVAQKYKPASDAGACGVEPAQAPSLPAGLVGQHEQPLLSVKLDVHERRIHVTRGILCHVWEGYDSGGGVIDSREAVKRTHELVGAIALDEFADLTDVRDELICLIWQAIVGTSRLPLTSLEAPLPAFVFGQLHYLYQPDAGDQTHGSWEDWLRRGLQAECARRETVKLVEFTLRQIAPAEVPRLVQLLPADLPHLLRTMFNDVSLSPYTGFVDNAICLIEMTSQHDIFAHLLRQLGRHLTAYDLVTFHHRGANYPDALLLDAVLKGFLRHLESSAAQFTTDEPSARLRRRALRQGVLLRRGYEGHRVPDAPTSPGENARVMPAAYPRVPEEQFSSPLRRKRQLFADEPTTALLSETAKQVLAHSIRDLDHVDEITELGIGIFIDRPLGYAKEIGAPDQTPLLAHEAYSPSLARHRLQNSELAAQARAIEPAGLPHAELAGCPRPVAALADVRRVADDFVILRTLPVGLANCLGHFDWDPLLDRFRLQFLAAGEVRFCVQAIGGSLILADMQGRRRLEMRVDVSQGYVSRAGVELPRAGLLVMTVWEDAPDGLLHHDLAATPIRVPRVNA